MNKRAIDLVRLVLSHEQLRMPLRRDEDPKKLEESDGLAARHFQSIMYEAQNFRAQYLWHGALRADYTRRCARHLSRCDCGLGQDKKQLLRHGKAGTQKGEQRVLGLERKVCITHSFLSMGLMDQIRIYVRSGCLAGLKGLILRSTLDPALIERGAVTNKLIETADTPDDIDDAEPSARTYRSLIMWNSANLLAALGKLYVILALIVVSGKVISDSTPHISHILPGG